MDLAGRGHIGRYEILAPLGAGGMGHVYRAHDARLGRDVALKVLPADVAADAERLARFRHEARVVAALNHPHIVTIFSIEDADGVPFITMELVEGRTLDRLLAGGGLPTAQFFEIGIAIADALAAAHRKGIVHRDLKPANIVVSDDGRVKVLDFGLAREAGLPAAAASAATRLALTQAGMVVGTVPYMSPEQIEARPVDHRSDLFSFGVVLYEMACGSRPFSGDSSAALIASILRDQPRPFVDERADLPEGVWQLTARCLEKAPQDRVQSAQDVHDGLTALRRAWESPGFARRPPLPDRRASIAVMPFTDLSAAKDQEWFCDGVAEEILNALTALPDLRVAARASAFSLRGTSDDLKTIGERLNVKTVLGGSVRRAGDRVRITVQLSNVDDGFQLWSQRYDRELKDIFEVQEDIARAVVDQLKVSLGNTPLDRVARLVEQGTTSVAAYQLFLQGRALLNRRGANIRPALELFQRAAEVDPGYSPAWAGIAEAYTVVSYWGVLPPSEAKPRTMAAARKAVEIDPSSAVAHMALGCARLMHENDRDGARRDFERALQLNPRYTEGRAWYALFYLQFVCGDFERGVAEARQTVDDDPLSAYATLVLSMCLSAAGHHAEAISAGRLAVERDPESFVARWSYGRTLSEAGRYNEAVTVLEEAAAIGGRHPNALASLARAFRRQGRIDAAEERFQEMVARAGRSYVPNAGLIVCAEAAGHHDLAIQYAQRAWAEREPAFLVVARHYPEYCEVRSDPRFQAILREMDAPDPRLRHLSPPSTA